MIRHMKNGLNAKRRGFTLIELAIVLAVASVLFAGLWRLMATGNTQLRDQSAADQQRQIIDGVKAYFQTTEGQTWLANGHASGSHFTLPLPAVAGNCAPVNGLCDYLPAGFTANTTNSYGQIYNVGVTITKDATTSALLTYSFMVMTSGGDAIPDTSGGRVASMIGSDGGFIFSSAVCGGSWSLACGAYGAWQVDPNATYGLAPTKGHIASRTYSGMNASSLQPWLARVTVPNGATVSIPGGTAPDFNTLQQNTYLGYVSGSTTPVTLYGAASGYGGTISNLRFLRIGRSSAEDTETAAVQIIGCQRTSINDTACNNMVEITGGVAIDGLLTANILYAGQFIYSASASDQRLKQDIAPLSDVLSKFAQIHGYSFTMKDTKEKKYGVIAQEVEKVFPDVVHPLAGGDYKGVDYMGLIGPLVAAVNELREQNVALKAQVDQQAQTLEALKAKTPKKKK